MLRHALSLAAALILLTPSALAQGAPIGTSYCTSNPSSNGSPPRIRAIGSTVVSDRDVTLFVDDANNLTALFFLGTTQIQTPFPLHDGYRCVGGQTRRMFPPLQVQNNTAVHVLNFDAPYATSILPGATLHFQMWGRTILPGNMSDALTITFQ